MQNNPPNHQGTTVLLALLASRPRWCDRVHLAVLLAPVAVATHVGSPLLVAMAKLNTDQVGCVWGGGAVTVLFGRAGALERHHCSLLQALHTPTCEHTPPGLHSDGNLRVLAVF